MSEHSLKTVAYGTIQPNSGAATGAYRTLPGGRAGAADGKQLPPPVREPDLASLAQELDAVSRRIGRDLRFQVNLDKGYATIQVLDRETGEIIRQIPKDEAKVSLSDTGVLEMRLYDDVI